MHDMNRCTRCVMVDTRPDTAFVDGVCSACLAYEKRKDIDWDARKQELLNLLERHNGRCIVPSSGGKDSHYQVLTLLELGAKERVVTATTCHLTSIGRANIDNLARYASTIEVTPNMTVRRKLNKIGLETVGDISWPEHASIFTVPFRMAGALDIPLIFYGESPQNQYGGPPGSETARQMTGRWVSEFGGFLGLRATDLIGEQGLTKDDMEHYRLPKPEVMDQVEAYFLGQFIPWDSHRNADIAKKAGMRIGLLPTPANVWDGENLDNAQTGLHDHMMYRKYGYGRGCAQASVDIRSGLITRAQALTWVREHDGLVPYTYAGVTIEAVLKRIAMTMEELDKVLDRFTNRAVFDREVDRRPLLKGE
jgi:N-acetyl sugar amidotransferase